VITADALQNGNQGSVVCAQIITTYQKICTMGVEISTPTGVAGTAGVTFYVALMKASSFQQKTNGILPAHLSYSDPNTFEGIGLNDIYLGRIYSSGSLWSQYGAPLNSQFVDWTTSLNTSVWDTIPAGGTAKITTANSQVTNLRIHPGARLKIVPGGEVKVTGTTEITEPKGLWIASDATGTGSWMDNGEASITYNGSSSIRIQRYVGHDNWHLIGFPLHTVYAQATFLDTYLKWYDEQRLVSSSKVMAKYRYVIDPLPLADSALTGDLRGWFHWSSNSLTPLYTTINYNANAGAHLVSGPLSSSLTHTAFTDAGSDGWNMVANMYPCPVDWEASSGWTKINVDPTIYLWSQAAGDFATYNSSTHLGTLLGTRYIPSMQGFFVHVTAAGTLGMDNPVKVFNSQAFWKDQTTYNELLDLNVEGNGFKDEAKVWFNSSATINFDPEFDNYKLFGNDGAPQFYSLLADNNYAAVNTLPWGGLNTVVPMGFVLKADASVTITASNMESFKPGTRIFLEDIKDASSMHELTVNPVYTFTASASDDPNRFVLHFYNPSFGIDDKNLAGMQIYSFEDYLYVRNLEKGTTKGNLQMYDLLGRKVFLANLKDMELNKFLPGVNEGYYMVRVVTSDNSFTQKVYLK